tara:strand:+ start:2769 stop:5261 length:2493 start_codon:yes stop_codon:yes gene_type:complete
MVEKKNIRLTKLVKEFNVSIDRILSFLHEIGYKDINPNSKISYNIYDKLLEKFEPEKKAKMSAQMLAKQNELKKAEQIISEKEKTSKLETKEIDLSNSLAKDKLVENNVTETKFKKDHPQDKENKDESSNIIKATAPKLRGVKYTGEKIDLNLVSKHKPVASSNSDNNENKKKRKRIIKFDNSIHKKRKKDLETQEINPEEAQKKVRETLAKLQASGKKSSVKNRKEKRQAHREAIEIESQKKKDTEKVIKITEYATATELASMMDVDINEIIKSCMTLGLMISMNQRLDKDTIQIVTEDFGYAVEFVNVKVLNEFEDDQDKIEDLQERSPIVTIMGHVDHGKTSLMDYIRKTNVIAGESGGITQHIGAYEVTTDNDKKITFLDTPGHEAFTAMRARGAKVTDIVVVVIAADDRIMPQTNEAISHAKAAGVPIIFALNKIDIETADPEKIKGQLAEINMLVEDWGGKYQSQDLSAKTGNGVKELLEKILLESEMLELRANKNRNAKGTVIEASLDKGKGYISTLLVQKGMLKIGDYTLAGSYSGKIKAMMNERGDSIHSAGPSSPVLVLGLDGAPTAGDEFYVLNNEQEAKKIAAKRMQLQREQNTRTQKHITLDEIGRRIAVGDFQELNIIIKGDVDGSIEALSDSMERLSTEEIKINIIQKSVGQISESDVMLAKASEAVIVGFQVRPSLKARKLAEKEQIDIRLYSVIYKAIDEVKLAMQGLLSPEIEERIVANIEIRETFKISKIGTIAGCMVLDGKINRKNKVRLIRDGVVAYSGILSSLKRFKDDVSEVRQGFECGMSIENYNDIKVGDIIEAFEDVQVERNLK